VYKTENEVERNLRNSSLLNTVIKQKGMPIFLVCIFIGSIISCTPEIAKPPFDVSLIKTYRDLPGVTAEEIAAVEALISSGRSFSFGARPTTEAFILPDGRPAGFAVAFCELLSDLFEIPFVLEFHTWDRLRAGLNSGIIDFAGDLSATPELRQIYNMSHSIAEHSLAAFTYGDSVKIKSEADLNGLKIGFLENATSVLAVMNTYPELSYEMVVVKNIPEAAEKLASGAIDTFIDFAIDSYTFAGNILIRSVEIFPFVYSPVSLTAMKPELAPVISVMNKYIEAGGIDRLSELYEEGNRKYLSYAFRKSLSPQETAYLDDLSTKGSRVPVALESDNYPMSFYNETDKKFQGIAADILTEIGRLTGIEFHEATDKDTSWLTILEKLRSGEFSLVSELLYSEERKNSFLWSDRYASSHYALLSKADYPHLKIHQVIRACVGVGKESAYEEMFNLWFPENSNVKYYDSQNDALNALEKGEIDLLMASENVLLTMRNYREKPGYKVNIRFSMPMEESYFGFNKNEEVLCSIFRKAQSFINITAIEEDWTGRIFDYSRKMADQRLSYMWISTGALSVVLLIVIVLFFNNNKTRELYKNQMITLSTIYNSMPELVYTKDTNGLYTSCNYQFAAFVGLNESELIGKSVMDLYTEDSSKAKILSDIDKKVIFENKAIREEAWYSYPQRPLQLFEITKTPLIRSGRVIGLLGIDRDITEYREAVNTAHNASMAKSNFLARMSHEIRTPMNAIMGMAELALRTNEMDTAKKHLFTVKQAGAHLLSIINDILDFSKIEVGKLEIILGDYSFSSLINDVVSIVRMRVLDSQVRFAINIDKNIPNSLYGDETRIRQVLLNLLSNAVKYTDKGFVFLTVSGEFTDEDTINLVIEVKDSGRGIKEEHIKLLFKDYTQVDQEKFKGIEGTGLGLAITWNIVKMMGGDIKVDSEYGKGSTFTVKFPQKILSYEALASVEYPEDISVIVYERRDIYIHSFVYAMNNLGVSYTITSDDTELYEELQNKSYSHIFIPFVLYEKNIDALLKFGGDAKIVVLTEFGAASPNKNFSILAMPAHSISIANILNGQSDSFMYNEHDDNIIRFTAPEAKILVVDDIQTNLKVVEGLLLPYKMNVDLCKSGKEAIEAVKSRRYDLVFMDHKMPDMDGIEATLHIRETGGGEEYCKNVPVIALTANAVSGIKDLFLNNGFNDFLSKPIDILKLNTILEKWLPKEKQESLSHKNGKPASTEKQDSGKEINIKGIDQKRGIFLSGGTVGLYLETLVIFCKDGLEKERELMESLETGDLDLYTTHVHALKSASANIGAARLAEAAKTLEAAGERKDLDYIESRMPQFLSDLRSLLNSINEELEKHRENRSQESYNIELLKLELEELKTALEVLDAGKINRTIQGLQKRTLGDDVGIAVNNISDKILMGEYEEAVELIETLL
jgi:PAS domain S-box-containing protein